MIIAIRDNVGNGTTYRVGEPMPGFPSQTVTSITVDGGNWVQIKHTGGSMPIAWYRKEWLTVLEER